MAENKRPTDLARHMVAEKLKDSGLSIPAEAGGLGDRNSIGEFTGTFGVGGGRSFGARQVRDPIPTFVGRSAEIEKLSRMLRSATGAVAIISGSRNLCGIGKTELACRLAQEVQGQYPMQILIDLRGQSEAPLRPELALERVIRLFPGGEERFPTELEPLTSLYRSLVSGQRVLVIADDARDVAQVRPLMPPPGSALLITSRQRLSLPGTTTHHALELDALSHSESLTLLRLLCPRLAAQHGAELASRVSHLPLALQILGNVFRDDTTRQFGDFMQQFNAERSRLEMLRPMEITSRELHAAIAIGWRNVDPWCRSALAQLSLLNASFDRETAEGVIGLPEHASPLPDVMRRLQKSYLLEHDAKLGLFTIHQMVRSFVQSQNDTSHDHPVRIRLAAHCARVMASCEARLRQGRDGVAEALSRFDRERTHIEAAQAWTSERIHHDDDAARQCISLALSGPALLSQRLPPRPRLRWMEAALTASRRLNDQAGEVRILGFLGSCYREMGQTPRALDCYQQCLGLARSTGDRSSEARALASLGVTYVELGQPQTAVVYFEPNLVITREMRDRRAEGVALCHLGLAHMDLGQAPQAIGYFEQDLAISRELGDHRAEGRALGNLGLAHRLNGQPQKAIEYYEHHVKIARMVGDRRGEGNSTWNRALALMALGRRAEAIIAAEASLRIREEIGDPRVDKVRTALTEWKLPSSISRPGPSK